MATVPATALLPIALQTTLENIIERTNKSGSGIRAVLLATTEGVPLGRVYAADQTLDEDALASIEWSPASKQIPLLGFQKTKQVTSIFDHGILIHVFRAPVVITVLCSAQCNLGAVRSSAIPLLKEVLDPLCITLNKSLKPDL